MTKINHSFIYICLMLWLSACVSTLELSDEGASVDDAAITEEIKARLSSMDGFESLSIHVESVNGEVMLSGFVNTREQRLMAETISRNVEGVRSVTNTLIIKELKIAQR